MQILSVDLENVKSYEKAHVTFTQGVNAIVGHNGAGKSTILEAIGFTLFDALDYNQTEFMRGGAKSALARVSFVSSYDERVYEVQRRIGSGGHYFVNDPELSVRICDGKADVLRFLRQHLQVEPSADLASIFKDAVGVPQGTLTAAFLLNDTNRKRVFEALLRVEEYSRVWDKLRDPLNLLKARKAEVDNEISRLQGRLERMPVLEAEIAERKQNLASMQKELGAAMQTLNTVQGTRAKLESARTAVLQAERALTEARAKLDGVQARLLAAEQAQQDSARAQELVAEHTAGYTAYLAAQEQQAQLDTRVRQRQQVESKRADVDKRVALHDAKARTLQGELEQVAVAEKEIGALQNAVVEQTRLEGELAQARQQQARLDDAKRVVAQHEEQLQRLRARQAELARQLGEAQKVEREIQKATQQRATDDKALAEARDQQARLKSQADLLKEQSQRLEDVKTAVCPVCEQPLSAEHRRQMLARNEGQLEEMRSSYRAANKQVQTLETTLQAGQAALQRWQDTLLRLPRADEAQKVQEELLRLQSQLDGANQQVAALDDAAQQIEVTTQALAKLGDPRRRYDVASEQAAKRPGIELQLAATQQEMHAAKEELAKLQAALAGFGDLDAASDAVVAMLKTHQSAYQTVLSNQRQAAQLAARMQEADTLAQEVATLTTQVEERTRAHKAAAADFDEHAYFQAAQQEQELQRQVGTLRGQVSTLEQNQQRAESELNELRTQSTAVAEAAVRKQHLDDQEDVLETIRGKLRQAGPYISAALNRQISDGANQIFSDLMQDYSRHLTWNEDYSISLEVDGRQRSFSQLSGGEQMSAALSVRLALLREMSSIDIAFFDEPTANLDEVRREALARQILNVRGFRQLFVISHDDTFEQATQNLIRVERVDGASRVMTT